MLGPILAAWRRARLAAWALLVRARLRRQGMRVDLAIGPRVRYASLPHVELDPESGRGGSLTVRIGSDVRLGRDLTIDVRAGADSALEIGAGTIVQSWCRLQLHGGVLRLGEHVHVRDLVQLKTKSTLEVGDRAVLSRDVIVHATAGVRIGDDCGIGERTSIIDSDHELDGTGLAYLRRPLAVDPIEIGRGVAVGANCVVLRGARAGDGAALAAGAVLTRGELPAGHLAAGTPARVLRDLRA